ncbi:MAG: PqqD family protein [Chitinophagaceae bacterium]|nr:PqqD family protein [Chitinophagaceae bacterium]
MYLKKILRPVNPGSSSTPQQEILIPNPVAAEIVQLLKQGTASSSVKEQILQKYEVDPFRLEQDWDDFMNQLKEANLLGD